MLLKCLEAGHWEIDTVLGKQKDNKVLLTLTERKTRAERLYLIEGKKADSVNEVMEQLKKELGDDFSNTVLFNRLSDDFQRQIDILGL